MNEKSKLNSISIVLLSITVIIIGIRCNSLQKQIDTLQTIVIHFHKTDIKDIK